MGDGEPRRRDVVALHELLGEHLAALELGGLLARPEDGQPAAGELVGQPQGERQLRADHGQVDLHLAGELGELGHVLDLDRHPVGHRADAGVAGRAEELGELRALA